MCARTQVALGLPTRQVRLRGRIKKKKTYPSPWLRVANEALALPPSHNSFAPAKLFFFFFFCLLQLAASSAAIGTYERSKVMAIDGILNDPRILSKKKHIKSAIHPIFIVVYEKQFSVQQFERRLRINARCFFFFFVSFAC